MIDDQLKNLKLCFIHQNYESIAKQADDKKWTHIDYLKELITGEAELKRERSIQRRIRMARFPQIKTLEQFKWTWPKKISKAHVQSLFQLKFIEEKANVIFLGGVGLGKTHLAAALGYAACLKSHSVLFATAINVINSLSVAQNAGRLKDELKKYCRPVILILDELGYMPIDNAGANLLFQIISERYERGSTIITTNKAFKEWPDIFNNDFTLASAILDRILHHAETVLVEGKSFRMKDTIQN